MQYSYTFDNIRFNEASLTLLVNDQPVAAEPRPLRLLSELLAHCNEVVTRDELIESVWDGRVTVDNVVANAVAKLRRALGEQAGQRIVNVPRVGYRFAGQVERIAVGELSSPLPEWQAGMPVPGRPGFELVKCLAAAECRQVWLVRQAQTGQLRVFKFAQDAESLRMLKREYTLYRLLRQELGERLDMASVHDANFSDPPFHLELAYEGPDLGQWASDGDRLAQLPRDARLALFVRIAQAVAAAHQVGVLHKDIKPANVLMRPGSPGEWTPVLGDFGSGHALQRDRLQALGITALGMTLDASSASQDLVGTAAYLAPELLAGESATVLSDGYALGVLLYQLVVGDLNRPLTSGWQRGVDDALLCDDIAAATDLDPAHRLPAVSVLIERVNRLHQRHLAREQAAAQATRAQALEADQQRKLQRRPWLVALVLALSVGLGTSTWLWHRSAQAAQLAQAQSERARVIGKFAFQDVLESSDLLNAGAEAKPATLLAMLRQAAAATAVRFAGQPLTEAEAQMRLAQSFMKLAVLPEAGVAIQRALKLLKPIVPADDPLLLKLRALLAHWLVWTGQVDKGEAELISTEAATPAALLASDGELAILQARARAWLHREKRQMEAWRVQQVKLLDLAGRYTPPGSPERLDAIQQHAEALIWLGRPEEAKQALDGLSQAPFMVIGAYAEAMAKYHLLIGQRARQDGNAALAADHLASAIRWSAEAAPARRDWLESWSQHELGAALLMLGNVPEAFRASTRGQALIVRVSGPEHAYAHTFNLGVADNLFFQGRHAEALARYEQVDAFQMRTYRGKRPWAASVDFGRARALLGLGQMREAYQLLAGLDGSFLGHLTDMKDATDQVAFWHGLALARSGRGAEGVPKMRQALDAMAIKATYPWALPQWRKLLLQAEGPGSAVALRPSP